MANRKALGREYELKLYNEAGMVDGYVYIIDELIGRGGSCLVYNAEYKDKMKKPHRVRVKECYPFWLNLKRDDKNGLYCKAEEKEQFLEEIKKFEKAYERYADICEQGEIRNSLVTVREIGYANNTVYYVMNYSEGESYSEWEKKNCVKLDRESLKTFFKMVYKISDIIGKIHNKEILYLDLKPENIWVADGTESVVQLFDFDTSIDMKDVKASEKINKVAYSRGYAALEMILEKISDWGPWTDIYSIGALVYKRMFEQLPEPMVGTWGYEFDYGNLKESCPSINPKFFTALDEFLHKTLAAFRYDRYQKMDEVLEKLSSIITILSDEIFVRGNYWGEKDPDIKKFFVGREKELKEIDESFEKGNHVVILSGMGGIGKTKLAKRYAYDGVKKGEYSSVTFMTYNEKIEKIICSEEMKNTLNAFEKYEGESESAYCERKLDKLQELWGKDDLVILDNVDCKDYRIIRKLRSEKYNLLVTSRVSFDSQIGYTVKVNGFDPEESECLEIFKIYSEEKYNYYEPQEIEAVKRIINYYNGYTYLIFLLAKMLNNSYEGPLELEEKVINKEGGMKSSSQIEFWTGKDGDDEDRTISGHIKRLFNLSQFSEREEELLRVICIFGENQINIRLLVDWFSASIQNDINKLTNKGWIEINKEYGFVKMHPLMAEIMYDKLEPTTNNCKLVTKKMIEIMEKISWNDYVGQEICTNFYRKIKGCGELYCQLSIIYCRCIDRNLSTINETIKKCEENDYHAGMAEIYLLKGEKLFHTIFDDTDDEKKSFDDMKENIEKAVEKAVEEGMEAGFFLEVVREMHRQCDNEMTFPFVEPETIRLIHDFVEELHFKIEKIYKAKGVAKKYFAELYRYIAEFYSKDGFFDPEWEQYRDYDKYRTYKTLYEETGELGEWEKHRVRCECIDEAYEAIRSKQYNQAISLFEKVLKLDENDFDIEAITGIALVYEERKEYSKAIECLRKLLDYEQNPGEIYINIASLYRKSDEIQKALEYYEQCIYFQRAHREDGLIDWEYMTLALSGIISLQTDKTERKETLKELVDIYEKQYKDIQKEERLNHIQLIVADEYFKNKKYEEMFQTYCLAIKNCVQKHDIDEARKIAEISIQYAENTKNKKMIVRSLLERAEIEMNSAISLVGWTGVAKDYEKAFQCYTQAYKRLQEISDKDEYLELKIKEGLLGTSINLHLPEEEWEKWITTDFYLLRKLETANILYEYQEDQIKRWKMTKGMYLRVFRDSVMARKCEAYMKGICLINGKSILEVLDSYCILKEWSDPDLQSKHVNMQAVNELTEKDIMNLFDVLKMEYACKRIDIEKVKEVIKTIEAWYDDVKQDDKNAFKYCMYKFLMDEGKDFNEVCDKVYVECEQMTRDIISGLIFSEEDKGKSKEKLEDLKDMAEKAGSEEVMEKCEKYSAINSQFILAEKK